MNLVNCPGVSKHTPTTVPADTRPRLRQIDWDFVLNKKIVSLFAGAAFLALVPSVAAAFEVPKMGFYLGLGLDMAEERFDKLNNGKGFNTGVGFILTGGYRFHPNIAIEGSCEYLDHLNSKGLDANILAFNANLKGYLTTLRFQPFVLLGIGITRFQWKPDGGRKDDDVGLTAHFGGGIDYYIAPRISLGLTVAYVVTSGSINNLDHTTIGLGAQYRF